MIPLWLTLARIGEDCAHATESSFSTAQRGKWERVAGYVYGMYQTPLSSSGTAEMRSTTIDEQGEAGSGAPHGVASQGVGIPASPSFPPWPPWPAKVIPVGNNEMYYANRVDAWRDSALARIAADNAWINRMQTRLAEEVTKSKALEAIIERAYSSATMHLAWEVQFNASEPDRAICPPGGLARAVHELAQRAEESRSRHETSLRRITALEAENARLLAAVRDAHAALGASGGISEIECACPDCDTPRSPSGETNTSAVPVWEAGGGIGGESGAATVGRAADVPTSPAGETKTSEGAAIREDAGRAETDTTPRTATPSDASQPAARWSDAAREGAREIVARVWHYTTELDPYDDDAGLLDHEMKDNGDEYCAEIAKYAHLFAPRTVSAAEVERFLGAYRNGTVNSREAARRGFAAIGFPVSDQSH